MYEKEIKRLEQKDLIPFLEGLEKEGFSIIEIIPLYHVDRYAESLRRRLRLKGHEKDRFRVISAKNLKWQIEEFGSLPSRVLLSAYASQTPGYVLIHSFQPNPPEDYKVTAYEKTNRMGLEPVKVSNVISERLMEYLK